jgi:hypothetical protein
MMHPHCSRVLDDRGNRDKHVEKCSKEELSSCGNHITPITTHHHFRRTH